MKIKQDYADPFFKRKEPRIERLVNSKVGFVLFIVFIILAGSEF